MEEEQEEYKGADSGKGTDRSESENFYMTHIFKSFLLPQLSLPRNITRLEPMYPKPDVSKAQALRLKNCLVLRPHHKSEP